MAASEPSAVQIAEMTGLKDFFIWAKLNGDLGYGASMAGSLLVLVGGEPDMSIEEFAGLFNTDVEEVMGDTWMYSDAPVDPGCGLDNPRRTK